MNLCYICNAANDTKLLNGDCYICENKATNTDKMIEQAVELLKKEEVKSFSISTLIDKDWLKREEDVWDQYVQNAQSIKNKLNWLISSTLKKATELEYNIDGDCRIVFDYVQNKVELQRNDLFIFGRYKKLVAGLSQSRWICSTCDGKGCNSCNQKGKNYESVEERIGDPLKSATGAENYVLHASGREDVDATNSAGRAFVIEIKNPQKRNLNLMELTKEIAKSGEVSVETLTIVNRGFVELVTESHFDKAYVAQVEFSKELTKDEIEKIHSIQGKTIIQQTPTRVAHRRADLDRVRKVKEIEVVKHKGNIASVKIKAEAGTYIKELISGDNGRTQPNISEITGNKGKCIGLEVTQIDDGFIDYFLVKKEN